MLAVICEDNAQQAQNLRVRLEAILAQNAQPLQIHVFASAVPLLQALENGISWDLALLDIELGPLATGIDLAAQINKKLPSCQIIFITGHVRYVSDVYQAEHAFFVLKQDLDAYLPQAVGKALTRLSEQNRVLEIHRKGQTTVLRQADIWYLERSGRTTEIVLAGERIVTYEGLVALLSTLPAPPFARCHHSFAVNLNYVRHLQRTQLTLEDGRSIPVSRRFQDEVQRLFARFAGGLL